MVYLISNYMLNYQRGVSKPCQLIVDLDMTDILDTASLVYLLDLCQVGWFMSNITRVYVRY